ncbi:MAG: LamG-like jellyroll fold domain-containing protein [Clostridia bacterium]|nr:LamG-like jellyroll fold domain-containing protein [Clostridia bacterium]
MGKKVSKRLLSLFLSVLMLATSLPFAGLSASAADESSNLPKSTSGAYLFAYFRNDAKTTNGENVFYAVSKDGYNYEALNGGVPVASASQGTGHSRDPYIMKAQDGAEYKYYMVATDANTTNNYNNTGLHTWGSNDLITWDELANPQFATDKGGGSKTITNMCWAPEAIWDPVAGKYMVYFATNEADSAANESAKIYYSYTADFRTFTEKKVLFDPGYGVIDADITPYGNGYVMLYKKEASSGTGAKKVWYTFKTGKSPSNSDGEYDAANAKIFESVSNTQAEGPQVFPISGTSSYGVLVDYFSDGGFGFSYTSDFESYSKISADNCSINHLNPSHGCIIPISDMEYYNLSQAFGKATSTQTAVKPGDTANSHLIARYFTSNNAREDVSGNGNHIGAYNGSTKHNGNVSSVNMVVQDGRLAARFDNSKKANAGSAADKTIDKEVKGVSTAWMNVDGMFSDTNINRGITISFDSYMTDATVADTHIFDFIDSPKWNYLNKFDVNSTPNKFNLLSYQVDNTSIGMKKGTEAKTSGSLAKNQWHSYVFSISKSCFTVFVDGKLVSSSTTGENFGTVLDSDWFKAVFQNAGANPSKLTFGVNPYWSTTVGGTYYLLDGYISDFCIYDQALSLGDVENAKADQLKATQTNYDANTTQVIYKDPCSAAGYNTAKDNVYGTYLPLNKSGVATQVDPVKDLTDTAAGYTYTMLYNPGDTIDNGAVFRMGGESDNYFRVNEDGTIEYKSGDSSFKSDSTFTLPTDKWSHVTLQVVPYISYDRIYVYIDGKQVGMYDAYKARESQCKTYADNGLTLQSLIHGTADGTGGQVVYGEGATGKLTDVNIYRGSIDAYDLFIKDTSAYAEALIRENMELFKSTMKTFSATNILTNMAPAYELYDKASRYLDAVKLGKTVPDMEYVAKLNADLYAAIQKMTPYKAEFSTVGAQVATGKGDGSAYETVNAKYSQNLLYAGPTSKANASNDVKTFLNNRYEIYYNSAVFLYDGSQNDTTNIMCMPVVMSQIRDSGWDSNALNGLFPAESTTSGNANPYFRLISDYPQSSGKPNLQADATNENLLTTDQMWRGFSTTNWEFGNYIGTSNSRNIAGERENHWNHTSKEFDMTDRSTHLWYNVLQFMPDRCMAKTGKTSPEGVYTIPWGIYGDTNGKKDNYDKAANNCKGIINDATKIYVVDVNSASPTTLMDNASEKLKNIDKFQGADMYQLIRSITRFSADTAMVILSGMDAATSWNPATDLNATDGGAFYNQFVAKRDQLATNFNAAVDNAIKDAKGMDEQGYTKLDADMDASSAIGKIYQDAYDDVTDGDSSTGAYTDSSAAAFIKAFDAAKQHYTDLSPVATANRTDKNYPYADNQAKTASKLHDDLVLAYAQLMKRADYSQLNLLYGGSDRVQISNNGLTKNVINENNETVRQQNYTLSTWLTFDDAATAAMKLSDNKDANADATYTKSEKTNQPMFKTGQVPVETLLQGTVTLQGTTTELSDYQTDINNKKDALDAAIKGIEVPADYTAYDAFVVVLGTQDQNAFTADYLGGDSVFAKQAYQGSQEKAGAYNTDGTNNDRAYVEYNGSCYRNIGNKAGSTDGQTTLDSTTSSLVSELNTINNDTTAEKRKQFIVRFTVDQDGSTTTETYQTYYGETLTLTVPTAAQGKVYKWTVSDGKTTRDVISSADSYIVNIQDENATQLTVTAYTTDKTVADDQVKITLVGQYGDDKPFQILAVSKDAQVVLPGNATATIAGTAYTAPTAPFYKFAGWQVNGKNYNYGTYTAGDLAGSDGTVLLKACYATTDNNYVITLDGATVDGAGYYDKEVTVTTAVDGAYGLAIAVGDGTYSVASYTGEYKFYANRNMDFYTITKDGSHYYITVDGAQVKLDKTEADTYNLDHQFPFVYAAPMASGDSKQSYSTYSAYTAGVPENVKITECGVLYVKAVNYDKDAFTLANMSDANSTVKKAVAKSPIDFSNQYFLTLSNVNARGNVYYTRPYVKYTYTYETLDYTGAAKETEVQCIAYGNVCNNSGLVG